MIADIKAAESVQKQKQAYSRKYDKEWDKFLKNASPKWKVP